MSSPIVAVTELLSLTIWYIPYVRSCRDSTRIRGYKSGPFDTRVDLGGTDF
jgi:hypothetical protein